MAIRKKGKRTITVDEQFYYWWGFNEQDQTAFDGNQIKIVPKNQSSLIHYGLQQTDIKRSILLVLKDEGRIWMKAPKFENDNEIITSKGISEIIKWVKKQIAKPAIQVPIFDSGKIEDKTLIVVNELNKIMNTSNKKLHKNQKVYDIRKSV